MLLFSACSSSGKIDKILGVNKTDILILNGAKYCHLNDTGCDLKVRNDKLLAIQIVVICLLKLLGHSLLNLAGVSKSFIIFLLTKSS